MTTVALVLQSAVPVARCEILDAEAIAAFNAYAREVPDLDVGPTLMFEFEGARRNLAVISQTAHGLRRPSLPPRRARRRWPTFHGLP